MIKFIKKIFAKWFGIKEEVLILTESDLEKAEQLPLSFEYKVVHNPTDEDLDTGEFSATIGDILLNIIDESIQNDQLQFKNRNDDTK